MIETLISSKTRIKLMLKFFFNSNTKAYLRALESEFGESSNAIRLELNRFEKAGMLSSFLEGNKKYYSANVKHPLFNEIRGLIIKHIELDKIVDNILNRIGNLHAAYVVGSFAKGLDSHLIDLILVGQIDQDYLVKLISKMESMIKRKIRYVIYTKDEFSSIDWSDQGSKPLLIWAEQDATRDEK
jgi:DNA-binding transcriptional ArsR family regulator